VQRPYSGIDLHRRRSVVYSMDADGERRECVRIANDSLTLLEAVSRAGPDAEVVIEATYGWYRAVDLLQEAGFRVHLAPSSCARAKMGSRLVRWAALEGVARYHGGSWLQRDFHRIAARRGKNKARVAVARNVLTLVYYGLRDGEIRSLRAQQEAA
jgi:hypothetical protein